MPNYAPLRDNHDRLKELVYFDDQTNELVCDTSGDWWKSVNRPRMSPSLITALAPDKCRAALVVDKLIGQETTAFSPNELGTSAHAALEDLFALAPAERTEDALREIVTTALWTGKHSSVMLPDFERRSEWNAKVFGLARTEFDLDVKPPAIDVAGLETRIETTIEGVPFKGFIDRLDVCGDGVRVVDYKTGQLKDPQTLAKFGDPASRQQVDYAVALYYQGYTVRDAELHYTATGTVKQVELSDRTANESIMTMQQAWVDLQELATSGRAMTIPARSKKGGLCNWCPLATMCPVSAAKPEHYSDVAKAGASLGVRTLGRTMKVSEPLKETPVNSPLQTSNILSPIEDKTWNPTVVVTPEGADSPVLALNLNSYSAAHLSGAVGWATELISDAGKTLGGTDGISPRAMVETLLRIEMEVAGQCGLPYDPQSGITTRIRGLLRSRIDFMPPPFDQPVEVWDSWVKMLVAQVSAMLKSVPDLWMNGVQNPRPWEKLASADTQSAEQSD